MGPTTRAMTGFVFLVSVLAASCTAHQRSSTFVRLERTECLGACPVFQVTAYDSGEVEYVGGPHAAWGTSWQRVAAADVERLVNAVEQIAPWHCDPDRIATDHPQAIFTVSRDGKQRRIVHDHGDPCAPHELLTLEAELARAGGHLELVSGF